jgi:hypothetical protein
VDCDVFGILPSGELREIFAPAIIAEQVRSDARTLARIVGAEHRVLKIPGPTRDFCVGPRLMTELEGEGSAELFPQRLLRAMRAVQWADTGRYPAADLYEFRESQGMGTCAAWYGERDALLPAADFIILLTGTDGRSGPVVPFRHLRELAGEHWSSLDECQGLVRGFGEEWPEILRRAAEFAAPSDGTPPIFMD